VVEVLYEGGDIISTAKQILHLKTQFTLKLQKVEVSEMSEIFSVLDGWVVTTSSYNQSAIKLKF
jgi:hypothetical protein